MNPTLTPVKRLPRTDRPADRHTRLSDINPHTATAARAAGRVTDVPDSRSILTVSFNSAF